jgi:hypothetical protein
MRTWGQRRGPHFIPSRAPFRTFVFSTGMIIRQLWLSVEFPFVGMYTGNRPLGPTREAFRLLYPAGFRVPELIPTSLKAFSPGWSH